jgi:hypothetical protein
MAKRCGAVRASRVRNVGTISLKPFNFNYNFNYWLELMLGSTSTLWGRVQTGVPCAERAIEHLSERARGARLMVTTIYA